ncbi:hypothetical protein UPYG_G00006120 [Umbra pygmaea]|uniref:DnaJ homolog subfamily C member 22 n=1 Tax=Umbra pygmaea TaxID=75934 RepID=A0ABD0XHH5_UMBPY
MVKKVTVTYALWAFGGPLGLHHLYLGRDSHALLWMLTLGGFGVGWARELLRIPAYVGEANREVERERRVALIGLNSLSFFYLIVLPLSVGAGVHLVSSVGEQTTDLHKTLLACVATSTVFYGSTISPLPISIAASVTATQHRRFKTRGPSGRHQELGPRLFRLTLAWLAFSAPLGYCIFHNTTATLYYLSDCVTALLDMFWFFPWLRSVVEYFLLLPYRILCAFTGWGPSEESWRKVLEILLTERSQREREAMAVLSVGEEASADEIARSYRELVKIWHPDHNPGSKMEESQKMFIQIQEAYETLLKRQKPHRKRRSRRCCCRQRQPPDILSFRNKTSVVRQSAGDKMNADHCNGRPYMSGSVGEPGMEHRGLYGGPNDATVSTPNSRQSSPKPSLTVNSIKVEVYSDEEPTAVPQPERREERENDDGWRDYTLEKESVGELGVLGNQGSVYGKLASPQSASPGPIRLPNGKLKCDVCGMICIGPNVLMVHKRSHTGERPFRCTECGASFTQKGNLLRHIKLHSGEKPFKCPFCNYACRRRDALSGHIRTHTVSSATVGKPYSCSYCGRSYKQQSSLGEHLEHCHIYLKNLQDHQPARNTDQTAQAEECPSMESKPVVQSSSEKLSNVDRLANGITKRKSSTPQKFLGEKHMKLHVPDMSYPLSTGPETHGERDHSVPTSHPEDGAGAAWLVGGQYMGTCGAGEELGSEPSQLAPPHPVGLPLSDPGAVLSSLYCHMTPLGSPVNGRAVISVGLSGQKRDEGSMEVPSGPSQTHSPTVHNGHSNGPHNSKDKSDTESTAEDQPSTRATPPTSSSNNQQHLLHHIQYLPPALLRSRPYLCPNPSRAKVPHTEKERWDSVCPMPISSPTPVMESGGPSSGSPPISREAFIEVQVVDGAGRAVRSFRCEHCRMFFLDHVMFTIHMGSHGFRQPFQCNVCGHRSWNRYQFTSHIIRGEHQVG